MIFLFLDPARQWRSLPDGLLVQTAPLPMPEDRWSEDLRFRPLVHTPPPRQEAGSVWENSSLSPWHEPSQFALA